MREKKGLGERGMSHRGSERKGGRKVCTDQLRREKMEDWLGKADGTIHLRSGKKST